MSRATELLEQATPLPWGDPFDIHYGDYGWYVPGSPMGETDDSERGRADATLAAYAVNRLLDYEAAVEALEIVLPWVAPPNGGLTYHAYEKALALLARLRDKVPS